MNDFTENANSGWNLAVNMLVGKLILNTSPILFPFLVLDLDEVAFCFLDFSTILFTVMRARERMRCFASQPVLNRLHEENLKISARFAGPARSAEDEIPGNRASPFFMQSKNLLNTVSAIRDPPKKVHLGWPGQPTSCNRPLALAHWSAQWKLF